MSPAERFVCDHGYWEGEGCKQCPLVKEIARLTASLAAAVAERDAAVSRAADRAIAFNELSDTWARLTTELADARAVVEAGRDVVECQAVVDAARPEFTPEQLAALRNATTALAIKLRNYDAATAGSGHAV